VRRPRWTLPQPPAPVASPLAVPPCCALPGQNPVPLVGTSFIVGAARTPKYKATSQTGLTDKERDFVRALVRVQIRAVLRGQRPGDGE